jgi:hypothetical protein
MNKKAITVINNGSVAQITTEIDAGIFASPLKPSAYAMPGFKTPNRDSFKRERRVETSESFSPKKKSNKPRNIELDASWSGRRVKESKLLRADLVRTVPRPQNNIANDRKELIAKFLDIRTPPKEWKKIGFTKNGVS